METKDFVRTCLLRHYYPVDSPSKTGVKNLTTVDLFTIFQRHIPLAEFTPDILLEVLEEEGFKTFNMANKIRWALIPNLNLD